MIYPLWLALAFLAGWAVTGWLGGTRNVLERAGLSMLLGTAITTVVMFLPSLIGLPIRPVVYLPLLGAIAMPGAFSLWRDGAGPGPSLRELLVSRHPVLIVPGLILLVVLVLLFTARCAYLPNRVYDSLTSFDLLAKTIAAENVLRVSLFDYTPVARGGSYPPFTALIFANGYLTGLATAGQSVIAPLAGFLVWLFGFARRYVGASTACLLLLAIFVSPDFYAFAQLPLTNGPLAQFVGLMLLYLLAGRDGSKELRISMVAAVLVMWTRADAIGFVVGAWAGALLTRHGGTSRWMRVAYGVPAVLVFVAWQIYADVYLGGSGAGRLSSSLVWNPDRVALLAERGMFFVTNIWTMGFASWALLLGVGSAIVDWWRSSRSRVWPAAPLVVAMVVSVIIYLATYYQTDPVIQDPLLELLSSSYRRGVIALVVPMWFAAVVSPAGEWGRRWFGGWFRWRGEREVSTSVA